MRRQKRFPVCRPRFLMTRVSNAWKPRAAPSSQTKLPTCAGYFRGAESIATVHPAKLTNQTDLEKIVERLEKDGDSWVSFFERPTFDFQVSVEESLMFSNSEKVDAELLNTKDDRLLRHLLDTSDVEQMFRAAYEQVLARAPAAEELKALRRYVEQRSDRPTDAIRQAVWAMMASAEFRFNH